MFNLFNIENKENTEENTELSENVEQEDDSSITDKMKSFFKGENMDSKYDAAVKEQHSKLDKQDLNTIKHYTGQGYEQMNKSLYKPDYQNDMTLLERLSINDNITNLTECIDKMELPESMKVYRGISDISDIIGRDNLEMPMDEMKEKFIGTEYVNPAFTSTSIDKEIAKVFAEDSYNGQGGLLTIRVPQGANALCVGDAGAYGKLEKEMILQRSTVFRIDDIDYDKGLYRVTLTAVGNSKDVEGEEDGRDK